MTVDQKVVQMAKAEIAKILEPKSKKPVYPSPVHIKTLKVGPEYQVLFDLDGNQSKRKIYLDESAVLAELAKEPKEKESAK